MNENKFYCIHVQEPHPFVDPENPREIKYETRDPQVVCVSCFRLLQSSLAISLEVDSISLASCLFFLIFYCCGYLI